MLEEILRELRAGIEKAIEALKRDLAKVRTGRANVVMLDSIRVDYYGVPTPVHQMATLSVPEPRLITIKPWEKGQAKAIEKAIRESDLGLNPQVDGDLIRLPIPALTEERRKEMVKMTKKYGEDCKVALRRHRRDAQEAIVVLKEDGDITDAEAVAGTNKTEEIMTEGVKYVDNVVASKEKEILSV
ncbi:MAG TPA: ribosome recycling factor [Blastocatellia bacterium]|nr:ribosome recycling factor [Blastocatellia bacterium]HMV83463.1 ribosome recycling factor [Blastocatellia bacterium]HMX26756.1 ribosome recycling factor [Blastocatellia bacterium]HMY71508.1 ribosome recycling factor [Blastocatellia bacterium]HMZ19991.1 ribosome recycling factor [Blastocatellia bacterium]